MQKFRVYGVIAGTKFLGEFDAENADAAEEMAANCDKNYFSLCHQCAGEIELDDMSASRFVVEKRD